MAESIHGDPTARACMDTTRMEWHSSPSGTVLRKRVHLVGPPEAGQVTSVVRYLPGATFPAHDHPEGEEILVLEGVFSDEHGDWPTGTYLLNPEGFRHAPFSKQGCRLFVKLRQYAGDSRIHVATQTQALAWEPSGDEGIDRKLLYLEAPDPEAPDPEAPDDRRPPEREAGRSRAGEEMRLERWAPGAGRGRVTWAGGVELFVLAGELQDEAGRYQTGTWLRLPAGACHEPSSPAGCELYVKSGGVSALRSS